MVKNKKDDEKLLAFLTTFLSIVGFVIAIIAWKDKKYVMFYAKQSLIVFIVGAVGGLISSMFNFLPIIGNIIQFAIGAVIILAWVLSWVYALSGKMKEVPVIGPWAKNFKF